MIEETKTISPLTQKKPQIETHKKEIEQTDNTDRQNYRMK